MSTHHAQLLRTRNGTLEIALRSYGDTSEAEICPLTEASIGIGEVRKIIEQANFRPSTGTYRLVVVITESITIEAQQALLKILEEPPVTTRFLFVVPPEATLLKTILSRFEVMTTSGVESLPLDNNEFTDFLAASYAVRLDSIAKQLAKKDIAFVVTMRQGFASYLATVGFRGSTDRSLAMLIIERLGTRGASNKMLLEALALLLPIVQKNTKMVH